MYPASRDGWADKGFCSQTLGCTPGSWPQCQQGTHPAAVRARCDHGGWTEQPSWPRSPSSPPILWGAAPPRKQAELSVFPHRAPLHLSHPASFPFPSSHPAPAAASQPARHIPDSSHPPGPSAGARAECAASTWREQSLIPPIPWTIKPSASAGAGANIPSARGVAGGEGRWWVGPCLPKAASDAWGHQLVPGERDKRGRLAGKPTAVMTAPCDCRRLLLILAP